MNSSELAVAAVALATPVALGAYVYGRWRRGEPISPRDVVALVAIAAFGVILAAVFAGPEPVALLVPPTAMFLGGLYLLTTNRDGGITTAAGVAAILVGVGAGVIGLVRLISA